jgi:hypothetical protein
MGALVVLVLPEAAMVVPEGVLSSMGILMARLLVVMVVMVARRPDRVGSVVWLPLMGVDLL